MAVRWLLPIVTGFSLVTWVTLLLARDGFWKFSERLTPKGDRELSGNWPSVTAVIPARDEAEILPETLPSVLNQDYPGELNFVLVDDRSEDGTGEIARELAERTGSGDRLEVITTPPTPEGWTGKVWALHRGFQRAKERDPDLIWLTDADIDHASTGLKGLAEKLVSEELDMASIMADLRTDSLWEKLLIPNFVYFFGLIYPFGRVNDPETGTAAAAGGCILVRRSALENAGGFERLRDAIIDDCALARILKEEGGRIWLGLSHLAKSRRSYGGLGEIWSTVSRSAFSQLNYSPLLLVGTVLGMLLLFVLPPLAFSLGLVGLTAPAGGPIPPAPGVLTALGGLSWLVQSYGFLPILAWYGQSPYYSLAAPLGGILYTLMTLDSGISWLLGSGSNWKGRQYG